jgi:hypothetical protein
MRLVLQQPPPPPLDAVQTVLVMALPAPGALYGPIAASPDNQSINLLDQPDHFVIRQDQYCTDATPTAHVAYLFFCIPISYAPSLFIFCHQ